MKQKAQNEELEDALEDFVKNVVRENFFAGFSVNSLGDIDFTVASKKNHSQFFLWAEAKRGGDKDLLPSFIQLILTIGKAQAAGELLSTPPGLLGAFDAKKIAFIPYSKIKEFLALDIKWENVTPSDRPSRRKPEQAKEFKLLWDYEQSTGIIKSSMTRPLTLVEDKAALEVFIKKNFRKGVFEIQKVPIWGANFVKIYQRWEEEVASQIDFPWSDMKTQQGLFGGDFFIADLLWDKKKSSTLEEFKDLRVLLKKDASRIFYEIKVQQPAGRFFKWLPGVVEFKDGAQAHNEFWNLYERPPAKKLWEILIDRRDLLVPQNVRVLKGVFYTPEIWAKKSKEVITEELGENWQDEYYIWDCCAGTGNLLRGLKNEDNVFASTLDFADVLIMRKKATQPPHESDQTTCPQERELNLHKKHIFQFDFLKDSFEDNKEDPEDKCKLPDALQKIINDPEKRKKLIIYINPPFAEATSAKTVTGTGENKKDVAKSNPTYRKYKTLLGGACKELYTQFLFRIYKEIPGAIIANFSTLKILRAEDSETFRKNFLAKLCKLFVTPADTFDNVGGDFPIGFFIWRTTEKELFEEITADFYDGESEKPVKTRIIRCPHEKTSADEQPKEVPRINSWVKSFDDQDALKIVGYLENPTSDCQNNRFIRLLNNAGTRHNRYYAISARNLIPACVYFAARLCLPAVTWLNNQDQFYRPNEEWEGDLEFHSECLVFMLFHEQNHISSPRGEENNWIPFKGTEVGADESLSLENFMWRFLNRKLPDTYGVVPCQFYDGALSSNKPPMSEIISSSKEADATLKSGKELWRHYHMTYKNSGDYKPNASFFDIRAQFQGTDARGIINIKTIKDDSPSFVEYVRLRNTLHDECMVALAKKIAKKALKYGFFLE